jgi:hypothetical protein
MKKLIIPLLTAFAVAAMATGCTTPDNNKLPTESNTELTQPDNTQNGSNSSSSSESSSNSSSSNDNTADSNTGNNNTSDTSNGTDSSNDSEVSEGFVNPGDSLGGGGESTYTPEVTYSEIENKAIERAGTIASGGEVPSDAKVVSESGKISKAGNYVISGTLEGKINVTAENVHLYLNNATLTNEKKVIESKYDLIITLIGENSVTNTNADGSNAIDCDKDLVINGTGSLSVTSTKNGIKGNSISITEATIVINAQKDGLNAEISDYDSLTSAPTFSYDDGGFVHIDGATLTISSSDDGMQADTFVYITGDSTINITTNGGAPTNVTESSKKTADGKGIKVGLIDWGDDETAGAANGELSSGDYLILIENGNITINSNDDAIHSNNTVNIRGGKLTIKTGDDGLHADKILNVSAGEINVEKSYEGIEAAKIEISGGTISVVATDDGINAADGTQTRVNVANNNCHIIISGGEVTVNAAGDGIDSNGSILISGGTVVVHGPTSSADAALDADGSIIVNGGNVFAVGALGMVETPASNSAQNVVSFAQNKSLSAGTNITLTNTDGAVIMSFTLLKSCQSIIISCPNLVKGNTYSLYGGDTLLSSFTISSTITTIGSSNSIGNGGGMPGGGGGFGGGGFWGGGFGRF